MQKLEGRFLCWDDKIIEKIENTQIISHKPERKEIALRCDDEWEGACNSYATVIKMPDGYRMYYRAYVGNLNADGTGVRGVESSVICVAESKDGITYTKPDVSIYEFNGSVHNNIVFAVEGKVLDTFSVLYDENPDCPADEKFKALTEAGYDGLFPTLKYYASADGFRFTEKYTLDVHGTFDSYNSIIWDKEKKEYILYYRAFHEKDGTDRLTFEGEHAVHSIRDIRVATSKDFKNWVEHGRIKYEDDKEDYQLYTNQITKYYRDNKTFIGFPTRYCDRAPDKHNYDLMPFSDYRRKLIEHYGRGGTAVNDCIIMTSSDGLSFDRRDEAFLTPGPESNNQWWYGNCYTVYGLIETPSDEGDREISFYSNENYRIKNVNFRRYTVRLDGFFSWYAPYREGEVMTKPFEVGDGDMFLNFSTSAMGGATVSVCDIDGKVIDGYESYIMFGDSTERPVEFKKPLSVLKGQPVRIKFKLKDAHLYSFVFK